ncbi:MAG: RNA degradosome polyphosphate kinase [Hyphomicrobiales bacterium]|nr:RNA degradosome polyphosphate kinase [Hyphomicrobiales bacterium]
MGVAHKLAEKSVKETKVKPPRYFNRELSWLNFNGRVLEEAGNASYPLLERLRFLSISGSNLDEFYMIRIGEIRDHAAEGDEERTPDGLSPAELLAKVGAAVYAMLEKQQSVWVKLRAELDQAGIKVTPPETLTADELTWLEGYFHEVFPEPKPIAVDNEHDLPFIPNKGFVLGVECESETPGAPARIQAILPVPLDIPRFIPVPSNGKLTVGGHPVLRFLRIEDIVAFYADRYFPGFKIISKGLFRVLRDSDLDLEEKAEDALLTIKKRVEDALKRRPEGPYIRLDMEPTISVSLREFMLRRLGVGHGQAFVKREFMGIADLSKLIVSERKDLQFPPYEGRFPERVREHNGDCFAAIKEKDFVVHHPYESFDVVLQFLKQAANDPAVDIIKWTLYRTSKTDLGIVRALTDAAKAKKEVTAFIEIKARFDEELNLRLADELQAAGVRVEYGFDELKTHAKLGLIGRWEGGKRAIYCHLGTGNYHPQTAKIYTDLSFFTADDAICRDVARVFGALNDRRIPSALTTLANSPHGIRARIMQHIDEEIIYAKEGRPAAIWMKMNALVDLAVIDKLYEASNAGVAIKLVVRGMCSLVPGVKGQSENIEIKSVIGRFLEHSRIYCFGNGRGLPSNEAHVYFSSADLMQRNLDRRVEVMVPLTNDTVHEQVLEQIMVAMLKDNEQSWTILPDGGSVRVKAVDGEQSFNAHHYFMSNPSLSGRGESVKASAPPDLQW